MLFSWGATAAKKFPALNWAKKPGLSRGKLSRELAHGCAGFMFDDTVEALKR